MKKLLQYSKLTLLISLKVIIAVLMFLRLGFVKKPIPLEYKDNKSIVPYKCLRCDIDGAFFSVC